ncbi:hypothetical protein BAZSYMB_SCAFFOLD00049_1 [Bathymodiolus azoricus thioautotrophic gill symbiont]|uniref:Uncharacterized protein n=1 Tax=Bathymodiolus azoricus thioautotrophic gill symbiont TaxID=235205 RepID=A0A1H6K3M0_9GAMM|nr:hypothetical protein BAZSYMB_SCAFFOLD00049_1 [Bathymodiolus azoricus thioautotrophic gill symbiont]
MHPTTHKSTCLLHLVFESQNTVHHEKYPIASSPV